MICALASDLTFVRPKMTELFRTASFCTTSLYAYAYVQYSYSTSLYRVFSNYLSVLYDSLQYVLGTTVHIILYRGIIPYTIPELSDFFPNRWYRVLKGRVFYLQY